MRAPSGPSPRPDRLVRAVTLAIFLQWAGNNAMLPLLPLDLRSRGGSDAVVGAVMAAYFAAAVVVQYPAGRVADRVGCVPVFLGGQACYAAGALLFLVPVVPIVDVAFRALQGAGAGGAEVAALAIVSRSVPLERRGRAFGAVYGAGLAGMAVGPLLGSLAGTGSLDDVFAAAGAAAVAACWPVLAVRGSVGAGGAEIARAPFRRPWRRPSMAGALLAAAVIGLTSGLYEACWTLLLHHRGAADWQVGLSWTLFAVPYVAMSRPAGRLADRVDRRRLAVGAMGWAVVCCAVYPWLPGAAWLLGLAVAESVGFVLALPAAQSLLGDRARPGEMGRVQGLFAASQTGCTALAAASTGALFAVAWWLPFEVVAACSVAVVVAAGAAWRTVPGRVAQRAPEPFVDRETSRTAPGGRLVPFTVAGGPEERGTAPDPSTR